MEESEGGRFRRGGRKDIVMIMTYAQRSEEMSSTSEMISSDIQGVTVGVKEISTGSEQISRSS